MALSGVRISWLTTHETALRLVGGLGACHRVEQLRHELAHIEAEGDEADHQTDAEDAVRDPEIAK
jgi:hypothetical protein